MVANVEFNLALLTMGRARLIDMGARTHVMIIGRTRESISNKKNKGEQCLEKSTKLSKKLTILPTAHIPP